MAEGSKIQLFVKVRLALPSLCHLGWDAADGTSAGMAKVTDWRLSELPESP